MTKIAIVGGGIGGLTAGIALREAGCDVHIYERAPEFAEVGAGISMTPNAAKGLESLGLKEFLETNANEPLDQIQHHGVTGETLLTIDRRNCRDTYGTAYYQLHRADLMAALIDQFGIGNCSLGKDLKNCTQDGDTVNLEFADGSSAQADVLIAADGLRSVVRDILFDTPAPVFSGHMAWRGLVPAEKLGPEYTQRENNNSLMPGSNCVTYPVRGEELVNVVALTQADDWVEEGWAVKAQKAELLSHFEGWNDHVRGALEAIPDDAVYRWGLFLREPLERWAVGRIALLGDAAHPMLPYMGQGASCAIEDGTVLGRCFAKADTPEQALEIYQKARIERASFLQRESNAGGDRLLAMNPYDLRDKPIKNEDTLDIFAYDPVTVQL